MRTIHEIAKDIFACKDKITRTQVMYARQLLMLEGANDPYGRETARDIIKKFIAASGRWHGVYAAPLMKELKAHLQTPRK